MHNFFEIALQDWRNHYGNGYLNAQDFKAAFHEYIFEKMQKALSLWLLGKDWDKEFRDEAHPRGGMKWDS